jgi:hypothetical protein
MRVDHQDTTPVSARGFMLIELLIASLLVLIVAGVVFTAVNPLRDVVERSSYAIERLGGVRSAFEVIATEIREAGANAVVGHSDIELAKLFPSIVLLQDLNGGVVAAGATAVTISRVPMDAAQGRLREAVLSGANLIRLNMTSRCANGAPACGFKPADAAVLLGPATSETVTIAAVFPDSVLLTAPLTNAFGIDSVLCRLSTTTFGLREVNGVPERLVRLTDGGAEQPLLDDVVAFQLAVDDPLPGAARRVNLRLRVQAHSPEWRGQVPTLFQRAGTASSSRRWLPDLELRMDVALRNAATPW